MSDEQKTEEPQDNVAGDQLLLQIAGLLLNGAEESEDSRLEQLADKALEMVMQTGAVKTLLKQHARPQTPSQRMPSTIGVNAKRNKYSDALRQVAEILQKAQQDE